MKTTGFLSGKVLHCMSVATLSLTLLLGTAPPTKADETDAKKILKAMSDYMGSQQALSFNFDATLEIVTTEDQKLALASSGTLALNRPDKIRVARKGGFTDIELTFDGKTLTLLGKNLNIYTQLEIAGTLEHLINELKVTHDRPLPAADLLLANSYDELISDVTDIKDLGTGVVGGVVCDHLAFRTADVDWQIWIAEGKAPYPYRYVISSNDIKGNPQYSVQFSDWKTGTEAATEFSFTNASKAEKVEIKDIKGAEALPDHFKQGEAK